MTGAPSRGLGRQLARNTLLAATGRVLAVAVWLFLTPSLLHALGREGFAVWALFFALTGYFAALDLGLVQGTLRHVSAARARADYEEAGAFVTLGIVGFVLLGLAWAVLVFALREPLVAWLKLGLDQRPAALFAMQAGAGVFVLAGVANVLGAALQGHDRFDLANLVSVTATLLQAAGILGVISLHGDLRGCVLAVGAGWAAAAVLAGVLLRTSVPDSRFVGWSAARSRAREAIAFGGAMQLASVFGVVHAHLDKFLLPGLVALAAVTPYELGSRVLGALQTFPQMLLLAMLPAAASMHAEGDAARLRELHARGNRYLGTASALLVASLAAPASRIFEVWLGPGHSDAALVLRGLAVATGCTLMTGMASVCVRAIGRPSLEAVYGAITLVLHVFASFWLLPIYGLKGAVAAALLTNVVASGAFLVLTARAMRWPLLEVVLVPQSRPALAAVAGTAVGLMLDRVLPSGRGLVGAVELAAVVGASLLVAGSVCTATGYFDWREALRLVAVRAPWGRAA